MTILRRLLDRTGGAQLCAVAVGVLLLAGTILGSGAGRASVATQSRQTWLEDGPRGQLVEVDAGSGQAQQRLTVAPRRDSLEVHQRGSNLVVLDRTTGTVQTVDLTTLLATGTRGVAGAGATLVLLDGPRVALADLGAGTVQGIDPLTAANRGAPYLVGGPLLAAVADTSGHVWALAASGSLSELAAQPGGGYGLVQASQLSGVGPGSGMTAHPAGVSVLTSPGGVVTTVGGPGGQSSAPALSGQVLVSSSTPSDLVPAVSSGSSVVVIVSPTGVVQSDVASLGCAHPLAPVVFQQRIYVPCAGSDVVVVLGPDGKPAGPAIPVSPGHNPELVPSGNSLLINVPGAPSVVLVGNTGGTTTVPTVSPTLPTTSIADPPVQAPTELPSETPSAPPSSSAPAQHPSPSDRPSSTPPVAVPPASVPPSGRAGSQPPVAEQVVLAAQPDAPQDDTVRIHLHWQVTGAGSQIAGYRVGVSVDGGDAQTVQLPATQGDAALTVRCSGGCTGTATVQVSQADGAGASAVQPWSSVAATPTPVPPTAPASPTPGPSGGSASPTGSPTPTPGGSQSGGPGVTVSPGVSASVPVGKPVDPGAPPGDGGTPTATPVSPGPVSSPTGLLPTTGKPRPPVGGATPTAISPPTPTPSPTPRQSATAAPTSSTPTTAAPATTAPATTAPATTAPATTAPATTAPTTTAPTTPTSPPPPAGPASGETYITNATATRARVTLTLSAPADWASFAGTCTLINDGDDASSEVIPCDSVGTKVETASSDSHEDYYVEAALPGGGTVDSAHRGVNTPPPPGTCGAGTNGAGDQPACTPRL